MTRFPTRRPTRIHWTAFVLALALAAGAGAASPARAQWTGFPRIPLWSYPGLPCAACPDTIAERSRTITVGFVRSRVAEARPDFGGYRIYRVTGAPDTARMVLIRRFSVNPVSQFSWYFSRVDPADLQFKKNGVVVHDSVVTFVDPDSAGNYVKVCRFVDNVGRCLSRGDSMLVLVPPPGPHDGFTTYYAITYEGRNTSEDGNYADLYVPGRDLFDDYARCGTPGDSTTCPIINVNHKALNLTPSAGQPTLEPTAGPTADLERVRVVPNPYRAREVWDQPGQNEIHFVNLPPSATIKIYTVAGDLVAELLHEDSVRDFTRWDLKNGDGNEVASGVYVYRVEAGTFAQQSRFVVIR
jgi:hypothetical protein